MHHNCVGILYRNRSAIGDGTCLVAGEKTEYVGVTRHGNPGRHTAAKVEGMEVVADRALRRWFPPADGTGVCRRIVKAAAFGTLLLVILLVPPDSFDRVTAIGQELIDDVVTGISG